MTVIDSHGNKLSESSIKAEENPQTLSSSEPGATAKREKKRKKRNEGSNEQFQAEVCPKPLVDSPFSQEGNVEAAADNASPNPKKKKKKRRIKNVHGEQQLQASGRSTADCVESDDTKGEGARQGDANGNGDLLPKPLLDTPVPIVSHQENSEGTALNPDATPKKKRKKKILQVAEETRDPSIRIGVEPDVAKDEGSREGDVNENGGLYRKPLVDTPVPIVSHVEKAEANVLNPGATLKKKRKKKILQGAEEICDHSIRKDVEPAREGDVNENECLCPEPSLDKKIPIVSHEENAERTAQNPSPTPKRKRKKKILQDAEEKYEPSIRIGVEPDVKKDEGSPEGDVDENESLCPKPLLDTPIPIVSHEEKAEETVQGPIPTPKKKKKKILQAADQICEPSIQICLVPDVAKDEGSREDGVNENGGLGADPLLDTKIPVVSHDENAEGTAQNPNPTPKRKKMNKKILQGAEEKYEPSIRIGVEPDVKKDEESPEGDVNENESLCPEPLLDTPIPIVSHEEKAEGTVQGPIPTLRKKKKKKILQAADQICESSIQICLVPDVAKDEGSREHGVNENGGLGADPLLDTKIPYVSHDENAEGTAQNPNPTPKRKKMKKKILQGTEEKYEPSIRIGVEPDVKKDEESPEGDVNENESLCPKPLLDTPIPIVSHEEKAEGTVQGPIPTLKKKKKKKILQAADQIYEPSIQICLVPDVAKDEGSREDGVNENGGLGADPLLDTKIPYISHDENAEGTAQNPNPTPKRKKMKKKILQGAEEKYQPSIRIGVESDVKKDEESPEPLLDTPIPIVSNEEKAEGTAHSPIPTPKKKKKKTILQAADQIREPSIQIGLVPDVAKDKGSREVDINEKDKGSREVDINENGGLCPEPLPDSKVPIVSHEEIAEGTARNPNPTPKRKRKKKILQGVEDKCEPSIWIGVETDVKKDERSREGDVNENKCLGPTPLLDTPIPIVSHEEKAEGTALSPSPTPKKKRKKKILVGADQICDPSIQIGLEHDVAKDVGSREGDVDENGVLCPLLDTPIPIISLTENVEATAQIPNPTCMNRSWPSGEQICDPSIQIGVEPDVSNEEGSGRADADVNGGLCPKTIDEPLPVVPPKENAIAIAQNPSPNPKKENLHGAQQICDPSIRIDVESRVPNAEGGHQGSERAETSAQNPNPTPKRKKGKNVQGEQQQLQICDHSISIGVESVVKKEGAKQVKAHEVGVLGISEERPVPDSTAPEDTHQKKDSVRKKKKALKSQGAEAESEPEPKESNSTENPQQCTMDLKLKSKVKKGPGANAENSGVCSKPEVAPQLDIAATTALELKEKAELMEVNIEHSEASSKPELEPSIDMSTQMKVQKKKRMREEKKKETNPSESHAQHPQPQSCSNHAPAVREIIEECPGPEGAESSDGKPPETPVQGFLYPAVALSIDPKIPDQSYRKDTATPIDQDQKVRKKNRKSNVAAASIEPTIQTGQDPPVDPATPVDPERMTKKSKKSVSALKNEGLDSEKPNADLNAETAVQKIERPTAKKSMGRHNAEPAAKRPVRRTEHLKVTESPSKRHGDSSLSCEACEKLGHRLDQCERLRRLSRGEEVCFFCGKIGHSLRKCGVTQAGVKFAKCLLCHEHGHFSYNCPQSENGKKRKELVANGAFSGSKCFNWRLDLIYFSIFVNNIVTEDVKQGLLSAHSVINVGTTAVTAPKIVMIQRCLQPMGPSALVSLSTRNWI
ncbi:hypothetical protein V8G54_029530 [Vigna mungo]|uniref:CCHC-type domain-containing protein n=1 Tax=Vigna mungo TaxID=3915 RepID=A0AAQ3MVE8_VIGMU